MNTVNRQRRAGILCHPTSLPGPLTNGDMGHEAYRFIEFLNANGFKVWQMLPLGPTHDDKSPYQCLSSHAGNAHIISLDWLKDKGWLDRETLEMAANKNISRLECLYKASAFFYANEKGIWEKKILEFSNENSYWLDDYALFVALKIKYNNKAWYHWPEGERHRDVTILESTRLEMNDVIKRIIFEQFVFFTQWQEIRDYAKKYNVELFGDMPIFVATDSADVWSKRDNFLMDEDGVMPFVAGVPPDAFSESGQRWGNPLYDWNYMHETDYSWWKERFATQLKFFDIIRIDHFRGLQACWQIPSSEKTAIKGRWVKVPGNELLESLFEKFKSLPLIAEDLGVITDEVIDLKNSFNLPGMKVLQFAFDGNNKNPHLPHCQERYDVVYTGTHDNDTTLGWIANKSNYNKKYLNDYIGISHKKDHENVFEIIRIAMSSVSFLCVLPMQDLLMLGTESRMNTPGTMIDNWQWRFEWNEVQKDFVERISYFITLYQR